MQAAQYISDGRSACGARGYHKISLRAPSSSFASRLVAKPAEVQSNHNMHRVGAWYVNGRAVSIRSKETFNLFELIDSMNKDMANQAEVDAIGVPNLFSKFQDASDDNGGSADQSMKSQIFGEEARIDVVSGSKGSVVYLNNIEKDADYARFSTSLQSLLVRSFNLIPVRKNVYTLLIVVDPMTTDGRKAMQALFWKSRGIPVRMGIVLAPSNLRQDSEDNPIDDAASIEDIMKLYLWARKKSSKASGETFLARLSEWDGDVMSKSALVNLRLP